MVLLKWEHRVEWVQSQQQSAQRDQQQVLESVALSQECHSL